MVEEAKNNLSAGRTGSQNFRMRRDGGAHASLTTTTNPLHSRPHGIRLFVSALQKASEGHTAPWTLGLYLFMTGSGHA